MPHASAEILIGLAALILSAVAFTLWSRRRRLRPGHRFMPDCGRILVPPGNEGWAGSDQQARREQVSHSTGRPLRPELRALFVHAWRDIQARFADNPHHAVIRADELLGEVMVARGYAIGGESGGPGDDLPGDHSEMIETYRSAHAIVVRHARGKASMADLRSAMIRYHVLFDDLVNEPDPCGYVQLTAREKHLG